MAQSKVNQYFVTRKNSFSVQPSKRRKVDATEIQLNSSNQSSHKKSLKDERRKIREQKVTRSRIRKQTVEQELAIKPVTPNKGVSDGLIYTKSPLGKLEINDTINDQAKTILHSRGSAILKASLKGKSVISPAKVSEVLFSMSPKKLEEKRSLVVIGSDSRNKASIDVDEEQLKRRDQLRKKYSNLLKDDVIGGSKTKETSSVVAPKDQSEVKPNDDRKHRMRNKYKHLLSTSGTGSQVNSTPDEVPSETLQRSSPQKAHEKYKHLTEKSTVSSTFQLPQKYKLLLEMFRSVDSVLYLLQQRSEVCTFARLKKSVQSMCGREFDMKHLAAMKTIYPNGFVFRQEKGLYTSDGKTNLYQLTIEANFKDLQPSKAALKNNSSILISRRLKFENALLETTKSYHQKFLKKLNLKISNTEIHRWHPHFKLEEVPDVVLSILPKTPVSKSFTSAADLLLRNPNTLSTKVENALQKAAITTSQINETENQINVQSCKSTTDSNIIATSSSDSTNSSSGNKNTKLRGVSTSLLERIRQKEQKKLELAMKRDPKQELRLSRIERLPEISRILKSYFTAEKKAAITVEDCVQKLSESYGSDLQAGKLKEHIHLLAELIPKWIQVVPVRKCLYVKLTKNYDINNVINALIDHKKEEEVGNL